MDEIKKLVERLLGYTNSKDAALSLGGHARQTQETIQAVMKRFAFLDTNDNVRVPDDEMSLVSSEITYHSGNVLNAPMTQPYTNFLSELTLLLSNWNNNTVADANIKERLLFVDRLCKCHLTMMDSIRILQQQISTIRSLESRAYQPVELAKHYLASLDNKQVCEKKPENTIQNGVPGKKPVGLKWNNSI